MLQADSHSIFSLVFHDSIALRVAAALGGLRKFATALVIMASPSRWWPGLLLRTSQILCLMHSSSDDSDLSQLVYSQSC